MVKEPVLGACLNCASKPIVYKSDKTGVFLAKCKCGSKTLDYVSLDSCIAAWNSKNTITLGDELKRIKERR